MNWADSPGSTGCVRKICILYLSPKSFFFYPTLQLNLNIMDLQLIYQTFTNPKVVTSMMLVALCLATALGYMVWLDRQDWRDS